MNTFHLFIGHFHVSIYEFSLYLFLLTSFHLFVISLFKYKDSSHGKVSNALQPHSFSVCFVCHLLFQFLEDLDSMEISGVCVGLLAFVLMAVV